MGPRVCAEVGCPVITDGKPYCPRHVKRGRANRSPTTQAQNAEYYRERKRILTAVNGAPPPCVYCGQPATTVDHVRAVAEGGAHRGNLVPACAICNFSKGARSTPRQRDDGEPRRSDPVPPAPSSEPTRGTRLSLPAPRGPGKSLDRT